MKIKKILIISLGSIGRKHIKIIKEHRPEIKIFLLRRSIPINKSKEEELVSKTFTSLQKALDEGIDAAIVASPAKFHIEQSIEIINANIPLFVEKPLSDNLESCFELKKLCQQKIH